jgi:hypothetical protein
MLQIIFCRKGVNLLPGNVGLLFNERNALDTFIFTPGNVITVVWCHKGIKNRVPLYIPGIIRKRCTLLGVNPTRAHGYVFCGIQYTSRVMQGASSTVDSTCLS